MMSVTVGRSKAVLLFSVCKEELCEKHSFITTSFMDIFVLLEGLNIHLSVEGIQTDDYAECMSNQSQLHSMHNIKICLLSACLCVRTLWFKPLGLSYSLTDLGFKAVFCTGVSTSMQDQR